jgi:hypothetical protein
VTPTTRAGFAGAFPRTASDPASPIAVIAAPFPTPPSGLKPDELVRWFASGQDDVVARRQLLRAGMSGRQIDGRIRRGVLRVVHRGVYALGAAPLSPRGRLWAAVLSVPDGSVVSHRSAAVLHGMLPSSPGAVHVTTAFPARPRPGLVLHHSTSAGATATTRGGLRCTTVPRTLVDLAASDGPTAAERAWGTLASRRALRPRAIEHELRRHRDRPGAPVVRMLLDHHRAVLTGRTRSELERAALRMCARFELPTPEANALLEVEGSVYEADLLWPAAAVVAELDDWGTHGHAGAFRSDRARDFDLALTGYTTVRLLWDDVTVDGSRTAARLSRLLERRHGG